MIILVAIAILTFSSLVYFAEKEDKHDASTKDTSWTFVESFWYLIFLGFRYSTMRAFALRLIRT